MGEGVTGKSKMEGIYVYTLADSLCCTSETDTHTHTNNKMPGLCLHVCFHYSFYLYNCQMKNDLFGWLITNSLIRDMQMMYTQILKHIFKQNDEYKYQYF